MIIRLLLLFSLGFGANYSQPNLATNSSGINIPVLRLVGIMAQFPLEIQDNPKTSGRGHFLDQNSEVYNHFYNSDILRCEGFLVDRPPHNKAYFQKQLDAVGNYYKTISNRKLPFTSTIISNSRTSHGYYQLSHETEYYAKSDQLLAVFFTEA